MSWSGTFKNGWQRNTGAGSQTEAKQEPVKYIVTFQNAESAQSAGTPSESSCSGAEHDCGIPEPKMDIEEGKTWRIFRPRMELWVVSCGLSEKNGGWDEAYEEK